MTTDSWVRARILVWATDYAEALTKGPASEHPSGEKVLKNLIAFLESGVLSGKE